MHQDGCEEIHIKRKAKKQLRMPVAHFKVIKHSHSHPNQIDEQPMHEDNYEEDEVSSSGHKSSQLSYNS